MRQMTKYPEFFTKNDFRDIKPGEKRRVTIPLYKKMFSLWDPSQPLKEEEDGSHGKWRLLKGTRPVYAASSSRDIRLTGEITVR